MNTLSRLIRTTFHRILRNPNQALGAIFIMFLTFFVGNVIVFITLASEATLKYVETLPNVVAFLKDDATENQVEELKSLLISTGAVKNIKYVSKEEALTIYKKVTADEPILQENVSASILPASIEVSANDISQLDIFKDLLSKEKVVESVAYPKDIVQKLASWTQNIRTYGGGILVFLLLASTIITLIVISLNISTYKDEIEIMRLVGATSWYIRIPFILEGIFYGLVAAVLSVIIFWLVIFFNSGSISAFFQNIPILPIPLSLIGTLLISEIAIGSFIGTVAAAVATRKYLKI